MSLTTIVIAQHDHTIAKVLADGLHAHFARVAVAESAAELRTLLMRHDARVAVLDLEFVTLEEVHQLVGSFDDLAIICTHRSPDEPMWIAALNAGAVELCHPQDIRSILHVSSTATNRHMAMVA